MEEGVVRIGRREGVSNVDAALKYEILQKYLYKRNISLKSILRISKAKVAE